MLGVKWLGALPTEPTGVGILEVFRLWTWGHAPIVHTGHGALQTV